jgi:adenylylsulfate kinase-like enzyme
VCEKRDKKGVYKKAKRGLLKNFTGGTVLNSGGDGVKQ